MMIGAGVWGRLGKIGWAIPGVAGAVSFKFWMAFKICVLIDAIFCSAANVCGSAPCAVGAARAVKRANSAGSACCCL
jgi:hypothetical protein